MTAAPRRSEEQYMASETSWKVQASVTAVFKTDQYCWVYRNEADSADCTEISKAGEAIDVLDIFKTHLTWFGFSQCNKAHKWPAVHVPLVWAIYVKRVHNFGFSKRLECISWKRETCKIWSRAEMFGGFRGIRGAAFFLLSLMGQTECVYMFSCWWPGGVY